MAVPCWDLLMQNVFESLFYISWSCIYWVVYYLCVCLWMYGNFDFMLLLLPYVWVLEFAYTCISSVKVELILERLSVLISDSHRRIQTSYYWMLGASRMSVLNLMNDICIKLHTKSVIHKFGNCWNLAK
jgi:hypothetical protein